MLVDFQFTVSSRYIGVHQHRLRALLSAWVDRGAPCQSQFIHFELCFRLSTDERVFGRSLVALCEADRSPVPRFVQYCIEALESDPGSLRTEGLYRVSAGLDHIQRLRCQVRGIYEYLHIRSSILQF